MDLMILIQYVTFRKKKSDDPEGKENKAFEAEQNGHVTEYNGHVTDQNGVTKQTLSDAEKQNDVSVIYETPDDTNEPELEHSTQL